MYHFVILGGIEKDDYNSGIRNAQNIISDIIPPLDFIDEEGRTVGLGPDYTKLIADLLEIEINYVTGDVSELLEMVKKKAGWFSYLSQKQKKGRDCRFCRPLSKTSIRNIC